MRQLDLTDPKQQVVAHGMILVEQATAQHAAINAHYLKAALMRGTGHPIPDPMMEMLSAEVHLAEERLMEAQQLLQEALAEAGLECDCPDCAVDRAEPTPPAVLEPDQAKLEFARWLYQTGRLKS